MLKVEFIDQETAQRYKEEVYDRKHESIEEIQEFFRKRPKLYKILDDAAPKRLAPEK